MFGRARLPLILLCVLGGACGGPGAKAPTPTRPLDELRAIEVIRRAVRAGGAKPAPSREVKLARGAPIRIDVGVENREFGIAYVTREDASALGAAIPPPNRKDERLRITRAGEDGEIRVVLLYQENYVYDDLAGEAHERTTIAAEEQLSRDVQDFIYHARARKFR